MIRKILALLLCVVMFLPIFSACDSNGDIPDGMYSVTLSGEPFILYVPEEWTDNRDSGISSAYYSIDKSIIASARYSACSSEIIEAGLESYVKAIAEQNAKELSGYAADAENAIKTATLDSKDAVKYEYTYNHGADEAANTTVTQYYVFHGEDVVMLTLYIGTKHKSEEYAEAFEKIRSCFKLCDKSVKNDAETDENTPEGMKIASDDDVQYICYVPSSWVTDLSDKMTYAYVDKSGKPNVTVTSFSPDRDMTAEKYFVEICEPEYKKNILGYERLGEEPVSKSIAERDALSYEYKAVYGESEYRIMQTVFIYNDLAYSITYTARVEDYDEHLTDVEKIMSAFKFR